MVREPLTLSLFPEYIEPLEDELAEDYIGNEDGESASAKAARLYFEGVLKSMGGYYDPEYLGVRNIVYIPPDQWPKDIAEKVRLSYKRYKNYINSPEHIKHHEIAKFKKDWISNALSLISDSLLKKHEESVRRMFQEIFEDYKLAVKEAIVDYILLCPQERKRLNIPLLIKPFPCSAERIALEGGFSVRLYPQWHEFVVNGKENMVANLHVTNIINSAILDWFEDFASFRLFESEIINQASLKGYTLDIPSFKKIEESYRYINFFFFWLNL